MACSPVNKAVKMETNVAIPRSGRETFPRQTADPSRSESFPTEFAVHQMVERQAELRSEFFDGDFAKVQFTPTRLRGRV